jgi:hypothetical protein
VHSRADCRPPELQHRTDHELSVLFRQVSQELTRSESGSAKRREAQTSLETISRMMAARRSLRFKPPGCSATAYPLEAGPSQDRLFIVPG